MGKWITRLLDWIADWLERRNRDKAIDEILKKADAEADERFKKKKTAIDIIREKTEKARTDASQKAPSERLDQLRDRFGNPKR